LRQLKAKKNAANIIAASKPAGKQFVGKKIASGTVTTDNLPRFKKEELSCGTFLP